jgi:lysosomal acid lipase/cholesteryl ester hydrolase
MIFKLFGAHDFLAHNWVTDTFAYILCGPKIMNPLCHNALFQMGGPESNQFNDTRLLVYMEHVSLLNSTFNFTSRRPLALQQTT